MELRENVFLECYFSKAHLQCGFAKWELRQTFLYSGDVEVELCKDMIPRAEMLKPLAFESQTSTNKLKV